MAKKQQAVVPRLRFPEFHDAGPWEVKQLGEIAESLTSLSGKTSKDFKHGNAFYVPYTNVYENVFVDPNKLERVDIGPNENQNTIRRGDILFTVSSETPNEAGMSSVVVRDISNCYVNSFCVIYRPNQNIRINTFFAGYYLRSPIVRDHFLKTAQGVIRFNLNREAFQKTPFLLPRLLEQQKIADCLASLDELIRAEEGQLATLKDHKKGLMQQFFPREGETTPRLRFPEFRDAGPWEVKRLGEIGKIIKGKGISKSDISEDGALPCIRYGELYTYYSEVIQEIASFTGVNPDVLVLSEENDVIIPASGETKEDIATASCVKVKGVALGGDLNIFRSPLNGMFLAYYVRGNLKAEISKVAQGDSVVHLYPTQLEKLKLAIPTEHAEQQKIADCLASLDDLIRARAEHIDALKQHKKGLMQQLFPQEAG